jgi:hypothetical protein
MRPFPHTSFMKVVVPISDFGLSHARQMAWKVAEDAVHDSERIGITALQMPPLGSHSFFTRLLGF